MKRRSSVELIGATLLAALGLAPAVGCSSSEPPYPCLDPQPLVIQGKDTGYETCKGGSLRRRQAVECPSALPRATMCQTDPAADQCSTDADCTESPNGVCGGGGQFAGCFCSYGCTKDADCAAGSICLCGDPVGFCAQAGCTTDSDCGGDVSNAACTSYTSNPGCGGTAFACQSLDDECASDADCEGGRQCSYDGVKHVCAEATCVIGRPFLVAGSARVAEIAPRRDWIAAAEPPRVAGISAERRAELCERWTRAAQMEHASIAAFARFALHLLSMGAPPELVQRTQEAMADETLHARLCFALASAYGGRSIGPGPLSIEGSLDEGGPRAILAMVIREGCVGETVAAIEAAEALAAASDPAVRAALATIARDEARHAELAWRTVKWALFGGDQALRDAAAAAIEQVMREEEEERGSLEGSPRGSADAMSEDELLSHGLVSDRLRRELRRAAMAEVIAPCARGLLAGDPAALRTASTLENDRGAEGRYTCTSVLHVG